MEEKIFQMDAINKIALQLAPVVRNVRIMQTRTLAGSFVDYDTVVTMVTSGEIGFYVNGIRYHLRRGDIIMVPPMVEHVIIPANDDLVTQNIFHFDFFPDPRRMDIRGFSLEKVQKLAPASEEERSVLTGPKVIHLSETERGEAQTVFAQMHMHYTKQTPLCMLELRQLCLKFLLLCCTGGQTMAHQYEKVGSKVHVNVQKAAEFIRRNYDDPNLSNEVIARELEITPKYLSHIFKDTLGLPIHQYITQVRIDAAQKMMATKRYNITEIALGVGYGSIHSFSKMFKLKTGEAPSAYMNRMVPDRHPVYIKKAFDQQ